MLQPLSGQLGPLGKGGKGKMKTWDTGAKYPATAVDLMDRSVAWDTPSNALTLNAITTSANVPFEGYSNTLRVSGFGFDLPTDAVILGILVRTYVVEPYLGDFEFKLWDGANYTGMPITVPCNLVDDGWLEAGGADNLWSTSDLTHSIVNSPDFGVDVFVYSTDDWNGFAIDVIEITIYYKSRHKP